MTRLGMDLSGLWTGVYFYPVDAESNPFDDLPPTPFRADLIDHGGVISGHTEEPEYFPGNTQTQTIFATVEGHHHDGSLTLTKTYLGGRQLHTVDYLGAISSDGNSISGTWFIYGDWSGAFRMRRTDVSIVEAVESEAAV